MSINSPKREVLQKFESSSPASPLQISRRLDSVDEYLNEEDDEASRLWSNNVCQFPSMGDFCATLDGDVLVSSELKVHKYGTNDTLSSSVHSMAFEDLLAKELGDSASGVNSSAHSGTFSINKASLSSRESEHSSRTISRHQRARMLRSNKSLNSSLPNLSSIHENDDSLFLLYDASQNSFGSSFYAESEIDLSARSACTPIPLMLGGRQKEALSPPCATHLLQPNTPGKRSLRWEAVRGKYLPLEAVATSTVPQLAFSSSRPLFIRTNADSSLSIGNDSFSSNSGRSNSTPPPQQMMSPARGFLRGLPTGRPGSMHIPIIRGDTRPTMAVRLPSLTSVTSSSEKAASHTGGGDSRPIMTVGLPSMISVISSVESLPSFDG